MSWKEDETGLEFEKCLECGFTYYPRYGHTCEFAVLNTAPLADREAKRNRELRVMHIIDRVVMAFVLVGTTACLILLKCSP